MINECIVSNCGNLLLKNNTGDTLFHLFPQNQELREKWIKNISVLNNQDQVKVSPNSLICSEHFASSCYKTTIFNKKVLTFGSLPYYFPHSRTSGGFSEIPKKFSFPIQDIAAFESISIPELPAFEIQEEDLKFKNRLAKNIEQTKELGENILFLPNLLEPEEADSEELPEMTSGFSMNELITSSKNFGPDDEDALLLEETDDNIIGDREVTKLSQITNDMIKESEYFEKVKILLHRHLAKLTDLETNLKKIHEYQQKKLQAKKSETEVYEKLNIRLN